MLEETLEVYRRINDEGDPKTLAAMAELASVLRDQEKWAEAENLLLEAYETGERLGSVDDDQVQDTISHLVQLYESWNKPDEAAAFRALLETEPE